MNTNFTDVTINSAEGLVAAVPYLIGFHPHQAVVVCALKDEVVHYTAHLDTAGLDTVLDDICATAQRRHVEACAVVGYDTDGDTTALDRARQAVTAAGIPVAEAIIASDTTWRSLVWSYPSCCPAEGSPLPDATHPVAVAMIASGRGALPDRHSVREQLTLIGGATCRVVAERIEDLLHDHTALTQAVAEAGRLLNLFGQENDEPPDAYAARHLRWRPGIHGSSTPRCAWGSSKPPPAETGGRGPLAMSPAGAGQRP